MFLFITYWAAFATHDWALCYSIGLGLLGAVLVGAGIQQDEGTIPRQPPCGHAARTTGKVSPRARQWIDLLLGVLGLS